MLLLAQEVGPDCTKSFPTATLPSILLQCHSIPRSSSECLQNCILQTILSWEPPLKVHKIRCTKPVWGEASHCVCHPAPLTQPDLCTKISCMAKSPEGWGTCWRVSLYQLLWESFLLIPAGLTALWSWLLWPFLCWSYSFSLVLSWNHSCWCLL